MQLTRYSDYCLRVLIYLAIKPHERSTIEEIATQYDISRNHLMKAVNHLARLEYIDSIRGKGGGISLRQPPEKINIGAVLRATEPDFNLVECFAPDNRCRITPVCGLKNALGKALENFFKTLDQYTLADFLNDRHSIARELNITLA